MTLYPSHKAIPDFCAMIASWPDLILGRMDW